MVAPEFMAPPISSPLFPDDVSDARRSSASSINGHGYLAVEITPADAHRAVPGARRRHRRRQRHRDGSTWTVTAGSPEATPA